MDEESAPVQTAYKDRRAGLIFFGVLEVLLGIVCLLAVVLFAFVSRMQGHMAAQGGAARAPFSMMAVLVIYGSLAVFFGWMGVGSMLGRRWARALMLVASVFWLVVGVLAVAFTACIMPGAMSAASGGGGKLPASAISTAIGITVLFMSVLFIILPGALVLFYRSPHVKGTCERLDAMERWTDRAPLPVLGLSLILASYAAGMLTMLGMSVLPVFGYLAKGPLALIVALLAAVLFRVLAVYTFRRRRWAWVASLALGLLWGLSGVVTSLRMTPAEMAGAFSSEDIPPESARAFQSAMGQYTWTITAAASVLLLLGYLLYVRKYFWPPVPLEGETAPVGSPEP